MNPKAMAEALKELMALSDDAIGGAMKRRMKKGMESEGGKPPLDETADGSEGAVEEKDKSGALSKGIEMGGHAEPDADDAGGPPDKDEDDLTPEEKKKLLELYGKE